MEIDEDYLTFCLEFKIKLSDLVNSDWYKENHNDPIWAEGLLDSWEEKDYKELVSLAICSEGSDWQQFRQDIETRYQNYCKMRQRMRKEQHESNEA